VKKSEIGLQIALQVVRARGTRIMFESANKEITDQVEGVIGRKNGTSVRLDGIDRWFHLDSLPLGSDAFPPVDAWVRLTVDGEGRVLGFQTQAEFAPAAVEWVQGVVGRISSWGMRLDGLDRFLPLERYPVEPAGLPVIDQAIRAGLDRDGYVRVIEAID
jgi:hypothetical protein